MKKLETIASGTLEKTAGGWGGWHGHGRGGYNYRPYGGNYGRPRWGGGPGPGYGAMADRASYYYNNPGAFEQLASTNPWAARRVQSFGSRFLGYY